MIDARLLDAVRALIKAHARPGHVPLIGIAGTIYMIVNISTDPVERVQILGVTGIILLILFIYSLFWIHYKMKIPAFRPVPMEKVLAMENSMYYKIRRQRGIWK